jgi:hypothetical protein
MTKGLELRRVVDLTPDRLAAISERRRRASVLRGGAVSPKLSRLLVVAAVAAGFGVLPMQAAFADSGVDVYNPPTGFSNHANASGDCHDSNPADIPKTNIPVGASVNWYIKEGKHNITPAEDVPGGQRWGQKASADLTPADDPFTVKFSKGGLYFYFSSVGGEGSDNKGVLSGMCGVINVVDPNATTTTTATPPTTAPPDDPPPTTPTTAPHPGPAPTAPTAPPATSPGAHVPATAAPAPTTTTAKADKKAKDTTTTTTTTTAPPPLNLPADAIVPDVTGGTAVQNGVEAPTSTPQGDAVALIKKKHSDNALKALIALGVGMGALGIGTASYKFAHRSSKYFPA